MTTQKAACSTQYTTQGDLTLNKKRASSHLLWLLQTHGFENRRGDITKYSVCLLETPSFGGVGHDEGDFVSCVRCLWLAVFEFHLFGISV